MAENAVLVEVDGAGTGWITLNRPEVHNAFDDGMIARLTEDLLRLNENENVRAIVLTGAGKSFSAGGDLTWMRRMAGFSAEENLADALALARLMHTLDRSPKPTLALVHGTAMGGGIGLVAACDMAIAAETAVFALPEVKLGLIPAVISPYVIAAVGTRQARRYFVTGEQFHADEARRIGLVHEVAPASDLRAVADSMLKLLAGNGADAMAAAKALVRDVVGRPFDDALMQETARRIASARASEEAQRRLAVFFNRSKA